MGFSRDALNRFQENSQLLSLLDDQGLSRMADFGRVQTFAPAHDVVVAGDDGDSFYLVIAGELSVLVPSPEGEDEEVAKLGAGQLFGEMSIISGEKRSATVRTDVLAELLRFDREPVLELLSDYPKVREVLGQVGMHRAEENLLREMQGDGGLADLLEG